MLHDAIPFQDDGTDGGDAQRLEADRRMQVDRMVERYGCTPEKANKGRDCGTST